MLRQEFSADFLNIRSSRISDAKELISRIESGKTATVGHDVLAKLALFFNASAGYLLRK